MPWISEEEHRRCLGRERERGGRLPPLRRVNVPKKKRNPTIVDVSRAGIENVFEAIPRGGRVDSLFWFQFGGPYATMNVFVWKGPGIGLNSALEEAAAWLAENNPGRLTSEEEMTELYRKAAEEMGISWPIEDWDDPRVEQMRESVEADMTYTESGWLTSYEWYVLHPGDELFAEVWEATIDHLAGEGDLSDDDIESINEFARKHKIDAKWSLEEDLS